MLTQVPLQPLDKHFSLWYISVWRNSYPWGIASINKAEFNTNPSQATIYCQQKEKKKGLFIHSANWLFNLQLEWSLANVMIKEKLYLFHNGLGGCMFETKGGAQYTCMTCKNECSKPNIQHLCEAQWFWIKMFKTYCCSLLMFTNVMGASSILVLWLKCPISLSCMCYE